MIAIERLSGDTWIIGEKYPLERSLCNGGRTLIITLKLLRLDWVLPDVEAFVLVLFTDCCSDCWCIICYCCIARICYYCSSVKAGFDGIYFLLRLFEFYSI